MRKTLICAAVAACMSFSSVVAACERSVVAFVHALTLVPATYASATFDLDLANASVHAEKNHVAELTRMRQYALAIGQREFDRFSESATLSQVAVL